MKYLCVARCQFRGIKERGDVVEIDEAVMKNDEFLKINFVPLPSEKEDKKPEQTINREDGSEVITAITAAELKRRLTSAGVRFKPNASKQDLYDLWVDATKPLADVRGEGEPLK